MIGDRPEKDSHSPHLFLLGLEIYAAPNGSSRELEGKHEPFRVAGGEVDTAALPLYKQKAPSKPACCQWGLRSALGCRREWPRGSVFANQLDRISARTVDKNSRHTVSVAFQGDRGFAVRTGGRGRCRWLSGNWQEPSCRLGVSNLLLLRLAFASQAPGDCGPDGNELRFHGV